MSKAEILAELPLLKAEERSQLLDRLCELQENDLLLGIGPSREDRAVLDAAQADFERDRNPGRPWREVLESICSRGKS